MARDEMKGSVMRNLVGVGLLATVAGCASADPDGLARVEKSFRNSRESAQKAQAQTLVAAARAGKYFVSISGLQTLRRDPALTVEQLTAIQDAIGKMQSRLAEQAAAGVEAQRHVDALQGETERLQP
jgi:hypothetical protein